MADSPGRLFIVATPIGNLEDITERAITTLETADLIVAEDTRRSRKLLSHFGINTPMESYHGDSSDAKRSRLIDRLREGQTLALVSDAGTPCISDPGARLVRMARDAGIQVSPIPGPSSITAALSVSGLDASRFVFMGYPSRKSSDRNDFFNTVLNQPWTVVIFEAPHRIVATLQELAAIAPDRSVFLVREATKTFEELTGGLLHEIAASISTREPRGEYVIVLAGAEEAKDEELPKAAVEQAITQMTEAGIHTRTIANILEALTPLSRNDAYEAALRNSEEET
ncbi:MAG: 16S rRNA (cytidine(1402)-2'-O)-methyltransferase [Armatimonadota bacterium]